MPKRSHLPKKEEKKAVSSKSQGKKRSFPLGHLIAIGLIIGVALAAYSNTFHVPFQFDDRPNITQNPIIQIKVIQWDSIKHLVKIAYKQTIRFFSLFTLALNYYFGGLNVWGYHFVNLFVHVFAGIFLYWFLTLTFNLPSLKEKYGPLSYKVALFASLIFISHPIQTQSVTYIVQRMASLAGMFYLLTMVLYVKGRLSQGKKRALYFGGAILSWLSGLFSKETVAALPLFVVLYEFFFFQNLRVDKKERRPLSILLGVVGLILVMGLVLWGKKYYDVTIEDYRVRDFTLGERVLTQFRVVLYYVTLLIYPNPSRLNLDYDFPISKTILAPPTTLISVLIVAGLIGYSIWTARKRPLLSFCILWYFGNLVIESSVFALEMVFEHRLYLPAVGPFILFSLFVIRGIERLKRYVVHPKFHPVEVTILSIVILLLTLGTYSRNKQWNSQIDLWTDCVKKSPNKARPYVNLGYAYFNAGKYDKALDASQKAIGIDPRTNYGYYNLSLIFQELGDLNQAIAMGKKALETDPGMIMAYYSLGETYRKAGQYEEAEEAFKTFIKVFPDFPEAHNLLAVVYAAQRQFDKAIREFEGEIEVNPRHALAHLNLGQIYWYEFKDRQKAVYHLRIALMIDPFLPNRNEIRRLVRLLEGAS